MNSGLGVKLSPAKETNLSFGAGASFAPKSGFSFGETQSSTSNRQTAGGLTFTGVTPKFGTGQTKVSTLPSGGNTGSFGSCTSVSQPKAESLFQSTNPQQFSKPITGLGSLVTGSGINTIQIANPQLQNGINPTQIRPQLPYLNQPLTFELQSNNSCRYDKIGSILNSEFKKAVFKIEETITNNDIILENNEILHNKLEENKKVMINDCTSIIKMTKLITSHQNNCHLIIENLNRDLNDQITLMSKVKKNINILENHSSIKIQIPSDYLETCVAEMDSKVEMFSRKLLDLESLILSTAGQESTVSEQEMIESTIMEFYTILDHLNRDTVSINDEVKTIKENYMQIMMAYGYNEEELENRYNAFLGKELI